MAITPTDPNSPGYQEFLDRGGDPNTVSFDAPRRSMSVTAPQFNTTVGVYGGDEEVSNISRTQNLMNNTSTGAPLSPSGSISTTNVIAPSIPSPTIGELPELIIPEVDEGKVRSLTNKISSPAIRALSREARRSLMRHYDNPNVGRMVARSSLAGFGQGLASTLSQAGTQARSEEREDRNIKTTKAMTEYQAKLNRQNLVYQSAWNNYMSRFGSTTSTQSTYGEEDFNEKLGETGGVTKVSRSLNI